VDGLSAGQAASDARDPRALEEFVARVRRTFVPDLTTELDAAAAEIFEAFAAGGVEGLLLKGAALSRQLYTDRERRSYSDIDLLVAPRDMGPARDALARLGYRSADLGIDDVGRVVHEERWGAVGPSPQQPTLARGRPPLDLHFWLAGSQASPQVAWDALAAKRIYIELADGHVPVLNRVGLAMHLAMHAAQHGPAYVKGLHELALGLERWPFDVWEEAAGLAAEIEAAASFAAGLRLVPTGVKVAQRLSLPDTARLDWEIRHAAERPRGAFHVQALVEARGLRARAGIVRRALIPRREWIAMKHPWARAGGARLVAAYGLHLMRAPLWGVRAWWFRRRAQRARLPR